VGFDHFVEESDHYVEDLRNPVGRQRKNAAFSIAASGTTLAVAIRQDSIAERRDQA
jgi:hypothetical protein